MAFDSKATVVASLEIVDAKGNPAKVDGAPVWALADAPFGSIVPAADGLSAEIQGAGKDGDVEVTVDADADLGAGVKPLRGSGTINFRSGEAVGINLVFTEKA